MKLLGFSNSVKLFESSHSEFYKCLSEKDNQEIYLKILKKNTPENIFHLENEFIISQKINHPGVRKVFNFQCIENKYILFFDFIEGETIDIGLEKIVGLDSFQNFLFFAIQLSKILSKIHELGIIHGDVNCKNILVSKKDKIGDMGFKITLIDFEKSHHYKDISTFVNKKYPYWTKREFYEKNSNTFLWDLFSLGITFYKLCTGISPFAEGEKSIDRYRNIIPPHNVISWIPEQLSKIILKLLKRNDCESYRSIKGLIFDLEHCYKLFFHHSIEPKQDSLYEATLWLDSINFPVGMQDKPYEYTIPQKLFDREIELKKIQDFFQSCYEKQKTISLSIVSGPRGIGKTFFIKEVNELLLEKNGILFNSSFEEIKQNIPYSAIIQILKDIIFYIYKNYPKKYEILNQSIKDFNIFTNSEFEKSDERIDFLFCQEKFYLIIQNIFETVCDLSTLVIICFENLHAADDDSLVLIEDILKYQNFLKSGHLFFLATYTQNDSKTNNQFKKILRRLKKRTQDVFFLELSNLDQQSTNDIVSFTLNKRPIYTKELSEFIFHNSHGNPFLINEFLKYIFKKGFIKNSQNNFDWDYDFKSIEKEKITQEIFLSFNLTRFSEDANYILFLASCIGLEFNLEFISKITKKDISDLILILNEAILEKIIEPMSDNFKYRFYEGEIKHEFAFPNDYYRQYIYISYPKSERERVHYSIGNIMLENIGLHKLKYQNIIAINHLNIAKNLIKTDSEKYNLAKLNFQLGELCATCSANNAAYKLIDKSLSLVSKSYWESNYKFMLDLYNLAIDITFRISLYKKSKNLSSILNQNIKNPYDAYKIKELEIQILIKKSKFKEAIFVCLDWLRQLGIDIPFYISNVSINLKILYLNYLFKINGIESLSLLPKMEDQKQIKRMEVLDLLVQLTIFTNTKLFCIAVLIQLEISFKYGNAPSSILSYLHYASILHESGKSMEEAYKFGEVAYILMDRLNAKQLKGQTLTMANLLLLPWKFSMSQSISLLLKTYRDGLKNGDFKFSSFSISIYSSYLLFSGQELNLVESELKTFKNSFLIQKDLFTYNLVKMNLQVVHNFSNRSKAPSILTGEAYNEEEYLKRQKNSNFTLFTIIFFLHKMTLSYMFGSYKEAYSYLTSIRKNIKDSITTFFSAIFYFYESLVLISLYNTQSFWMKKKFLSIVRQNQKRLKKWARNSPENFLHKYYILKAEEYNVLNNYKKAKKYYELAIEQAIETKLSNDIAIIFELAGKFYLRNNKKRFAGYCFQDAHKYYQKWGALAKMKYIESKYFDFILQNENIKNEYSLVAYKNDKNDEKFDVESIIHAAQAISGEIVLEKLLNKMMNLVLFNANADEGCLILSRNGNWYVEAEGNLETSKMKVLQSLPLENAQNRNLSIEVVNYTIKSKQMVLLDNPSFEGKFTYDPYIREHKPKSVLSIPLLNQGKLVGILFLVNHKMTSSFTEHKIKILKILSTQMAISLENSYLYSTLEQKVEERTSLLKQHKANLKAQIENTSDMICSINRGYRLITYNSNFKKGYENFFKIDAKMQMDILEALPSTFKEKFQMSFQKAIQGEQWIEEHFHIDQMSNKKQFFEYSYNPIINDKNIITGVTIFIRNITERKKAEEDLRILSRAVEQSSSIIFITNLEGKIEFVNPAFSKTSGFSPLEAIGSNPKILKSGEHSKEFYKNLWDTIRNGETWKGEILNKKKNGELHWEFTTISPVKNKEGIPTHYLAITEDITERINREKELKEAKEKAEIANRAKSEFLTNISHEIRTPMNAILGFAELLKNNIQDMDNKQYTINIISSAKTLLALINDVLDLSKAESGKLDIKYKIVEFRTLLDEMKDIFSQSVQEKNLEFKIILDPDLPVYLVLDEIRIRQILLNLIGNAVKFTNFGTIKLGAFTKKKYVDKKIDLSIFVEDTGKGIPEDEQKRIFEAFVQVSNQDHARYGGTGLGLSISNRLAELMNGKIELQSKVGVGSKFIVHLESVQIASKKESEDMILDIIPSEEENKAQSEVKIINEKNINKLYNTIQEDKIDELIEKLNKEALEIWQEIMDIQDVNKIEIFTTLLKTLGEEYNCDVLVEFGNHLNISDNLFDIDKFLKTMEEFPKIIESLKNFQYPKVE